MPIDLTKPLSWSNAQGDELSMLKDLQGNILDGHGRRSTLHMFLRFGPDITKVRDFLHALEPDVTSAHQQLLDAKVHRDTGLSGGPFVGLMISASGYAALNADAKKPVVADDGAFDEGMRARRAILNDPADTFLEEPYRDRIDAMILIGGDPDSTSKWSSVQAENVGTRVMNILNGCATIVRIETGRAIFRAAAGSTQDVQEKLEGIEHFGYVDGRSQPLMLQELIDREAVESDGISVWNAVFPLSQVLVPDPGAPADTAATAFGSFFVFRKLEQNVKGFKEAETELGDRLGLGELAGAMLVGRFEDGTPVVLQREEGADNPVMNNFDYAGDPKGLRCPHYAHIRKTNPRGDTERLGSTIADERKRIMARRGMTYGTRDSTINPTDKPTGGVGLMFMAFQANIHDQFEFTQQSWANSDTFLSGFLSKDAFAPGRDPVIGQRGTANVATLPVRDRWGSEKATVHDESLAEYVRHLGGEYFFAPAKSTLRAL